MSGGAFEYAQYRISEIYSVIEDEIYGHEEAEYVKKHHHTMPNRCGYSKETIKEFKKGIKILKMAEIYAQRIDWLLSGDDGEENFHERLKKELEQLKKKNKRDLEKQMNRRYTISTLVTTGTSEGESLGTTKDVEG